VLLLGLAFGWWADRSRLAKQLRIRDHEVKILSPAKSDAEDLSRVLRETFRESEELSITSDPRTNTIIARGSPEDVAMIEAMVLRLDQ
jgi:hypothetical protein